MYEMHPALFLKTGCDTGSASRLYGYDGGERSAAINKMLVNFEAKSEQQS
jgi:hypothetical protein